jgi:hypothetical protein
MGRVGCQGTEREVWGREAVSTEQVQKKTSKDPLRNRPEKKRREERKKKREFLDKPKPTPITTLPF